MPRRYDPDDIRRTPTRVGDRSWVFPVVIGIVALIVVIASMIFGDR